MLPAYFYHVVLQIVIGFCALLAHNLTFADVYTCKDETGRAHVSDRPIPECARVRMHVESNNGTNPRDILPPVTPEQRKKIEEEKARQKQQALDLEQKKKEERRLMARFNSEQDIEVMRKKSLEVTTEKIRNTNEQIKLIRQLIAELNDEKLKQQKNATAPTNAVDSRIHELNATLQKTLAQNQINESELASINAQFDATLIQFREITQSKTK